MAADVSRQNIKNEAKSNVLITRDFLGVSAGSGVGGGDGGGSGCFGIESTELDLDLHVPSGFEKRLDLKSGKVYIQRCSPNSSSSSSPDRHHHNTNFFLNQTTSPSPKCQDLNFQPHSKPTLNLFDEPTLDLKLVSPSPPPTATNTTSATISSFYQSVCTLDKVKSALDRAERESSTNSNYNKKRSNANNNASILSSSSLSPSNSSSNMSVDDAGAGSDDKFTGKLVPSSSTMSDDQNGDNNNTGLLVTAACPGCLLYVLISKCNPKCPKCGMTIHLPLVAKKPRIDLNICM